MPVTMGVLQGMDRFLAFGVLLFATAVVAARCSACRGSLAGGGAGGAIAGQALGLAVVDRRGAVGLPHVARRRAAAASPRSGMRRRIDLPALSASGAFIGFAVLSNLDVVLARSSSTPTRSASTRRSRRSARS